MGEITKVRRFTQARGRARRMALLEAARILLSSRELDEIGLTSIAEQAEIPVSSAYHFYPDVKELHKDLCRLIATQMIETPVKIAPSEDWQGVVRQYFEAAAVFFNSDGAARQLMLGPKTAPDIRSAGCNDDFRFGDELMGLIDGQFALPELSDASGLFYRTLRISETIFAISVAEHGHVTEFYVREANNAAIAYLQVYLPKILMARSVA